jgi:hypothetical protein
VRNEVLVASAAEYARSPRGQGDFVKMPATWLNGRCWEDDRKSWQHDGAPGQKKDPRGNLGAREELIRELNFGRFDE